MQKVTLWHKFNGESWELNHLEDGHCEAPTPTPKVPEHKRAWANGKWGKKHAWLSGDVPPKVIHQLPITVGSRVRSHVSVLGERVPTHIGIVMEISADGSICAVDRGSLHGCRTLIQLENATDLTVEPLE